MQSPSLNIYGLLFRDATREVNIWGNGLGNPDTFYVHGPSGNVIDSGATTVPAPGPAVLVAAGLGLCFSRRRRRHESAG